MKPLGLRKSSAPHSAECAVCHPVTRKQSKRLTPRDIKQGAQLARTGRQRDKRMQRKVEP